jgi:hypothetical protein
MFSRANLMSGKTNSDHTIAIIAKKNLYRSVFSMEKINLAYEALQGF